jgi:hypothetical protein
MQVKGLRDALGKKGVSSNYSYEYADKTWVPHTVPRHSPIRARLIVPNLPRGAGMCVLCVVCVCV